MRRHFQSDHEQRAGLVEKEESQFEPFNPHLARREGPFSSFGLQTHVQPGQGAHGVGRHAPDEAYRPPEFGEGNPTFQTHAQS